MGTKTGTIKPLPPTRRKRVPLRVETLQLIIRAVNQDFQEAARERSARERLADGLRDLTGEGQTMRLVRDADGQEYAVLDGPTRREPRLPRSAETMARVEKERARLTAVLQRPRRQPPKYPHLDAAMSDAIARRESPTLVVDAAIAALRSVDPRLLATADRRRQFRDRLKKRARRSKRAGQSLSEAD